LDKTSEEFLDYFIGGLAQTRILLLLLYRPEYTHPWGSKSYYNKIGVEQLSEAKSAELVQSILKAAAVAPDLSRFILNRAAGNPLFMEELTHSLVESGEIQNKDNQFVLGPKASAIQVPDTVQGIIAARMDRLTDEIKRTMQVASVIGRDFAYRILETITGLPEELKSYLIRLQDLEFIYERSLFPELEYIFKHAVTQEVAYNSLLLQRRRTLHEEIGDAIETIYADKREEFWEILAYHYARSKNTAKAYHYLKLAGDKATGKYAAWEAVGYYREALRFLAMLPSSDENLRHKLDLVHAILVPAIVLGFPEDTLPILKEGAQISQELGDNKSLIRFYSNIGLFYANRGKHDEGLTYSQKAFEEAERIRDIETMAQSGPDLTLAYITRGEYARSLEVAAKVIARIEETDTQSETFGGPVNVYPTFLSIYGMATGMLGNFEEAIAFCDKGLAEAHAIGRPMSLGICEYYYGTVILLQSDARLATEHFQKSVTYLEEARFLQPLSLAWSGLGLAQMQLGDPETGRAYVEKGLKIHRDAGIEWYLSTHLFFLSLSHYHLGDLKRARDLLQEAYQSAQKGSEEHVAGRALIWLGRLCGKADPPQMERASEYLQEGIAILDELGTKPDLAQGHLFLAELFAAQGRREEAREGLARAETMFAEMGMKGGLAEVQELRRESPEGEE
jgi:tetratricopeptide (TPR) repeat protein